MSQKYLGPVRWLPALFLIVLPVICLAEGDQKPALSEQQTALALVGRYAGQLKPALKAALMDGGPVHAIDVCSNRAPEIAAALSEESGWQIRRVSLQPRNQSSAVPDKWERGVLERFNQQRQSGVPAADLVYAAQVESADAESEFRLMKAQPVEPLCLTCHGQHLAPEVVAALSQKYPDDVATGYKLGDIRGAFSLKTNSEFPAAER